MKRNARYLLTAAAFAALLFASGCSDNGAEEAGESVDEAIEDAGDEIEEATD